MKVLMLLLLVPGVAWAQEQDSGYAAPDARDGGTGETTDSVSEDLTQNEQQPSYELEEVVVTATRTPILRLDTALPVGIVSEKDIEEKMPISVGDAIRGLPGVSLYNNGGIYYQNPSIRGLSGRRVIMLVDGERINSEKTMGVTAFFLNTDDVARIEVMRGPSSVMYGTDGLGGVVNVITRDPFLNTGFSGKVGSSIASNNLELSETLALRYATPSWFASASGRFRDANNYTSGSGTIDNSYYHDSSFRGDLGLRIDKHTLRLGALHHFSTNIGKAADDLDDEKNRRIFFPGDDVTRLSLRYEGSDLGPIVRTIQASSFFSYNYRHNVAQVFRDPGLWADPAVRSDKRSEIYHAGGQALVTLEPGGHHILTAGINTNFKNVDIFSDSITYMPPPLDPFIAPRTTDFDDAREFTLGIYTQDEWRPWSFVQVNMGIRFDLVESWNTPVSSEEEPAPAAMNSRDYATSGNFGLVLHTSDTTRITMNAGRAFRVPTIHEKYLTTATCLGMYCGDVSLKPEESLNLDIGFKGILGSLLFEVYGYNTLVDNLITAVPQAESNECDYRYTNTAKAWLIGGESKISLLFDDLFASRLDLKPFLSASYVWAKDRTSDEPLSQIPPLNTSVGLRFDARFESFVRSLYLEIRGTYHHPQDRVAAHTDGNGVRIEDEKRTQQYLLLGATAGIVLSEFWIFKSGRVNLVCENMTNTAYRDHLSATEGIGRNFKLALALNF